MAHDVQLKRWAYLAYGVNFNTKKAVSTSESEKAYELLVDAIGLHEAKKEIRSAGRACKHHGWPK